MPDEVRRSIDVDATPDETWDALTDPERLEDWFADEVEAEGDELTFRWDDGEERHAVIEEAEAPRVLRFRWHVGDDPREGASEVTFRLDDAPGGTRVTVVERGLRGLPLARRAGAGWGPALCALAAHASLVLA